MENNVLEPATYAGVEINPLFNLIFENKNNIILHLTENEIVYKHPTDSKRNGKGMIYSVDVIDNERHMHPQFDSDVIPDDKAINEEEFVADMVKRAYAAMDKYLEMHPEGVMPLTTKGW